MSIKTSKKQLDIAFFLQSVFIAVPNNENFLGYADWNSNQKSQNDITSALPLSRHYFCWRPACSCNYSDTETLSEISVKLGRLIING